jgi:hypothetical protein
VAGRGGGALKTGSHIANAKQTPLCNLYLTMLQTMGVQAESFGDSNGVIKEMLVG